MVAHQIKPRPIPPPGEYAENLVTDRDKAEADELTRGSDGSRTVLFIVIVVLAYYFGYYFCDSLQREFGRPNGPEALLYLLSYFLGPWFIAYLVTKNIRSVVFKSKLQKVVTERLHNEETQTVTEALIEVEQIYGAQENNLTALDNLLEQAETSIKQAQKLFKERAYTPFWDSIEDAVERLRQFDKYVTHINQSAKEYYSHLEGREHTFPAFPVKSEDLPKPEALIKRLSERIAEAQRDFQFSSIFEQRRTTSAIVTGFRNTQEAINSLRDDVVSSLSDLQNSLESGLENISSNIRDGFDDLTESQQQSAAELRETLDGHARATSKHQKFTEGALDNIQNRRKPLASETKQAFRRGKPGRGQ